MKNKLLTILILICSALAVSCIAAGCGSGKAASYDHLVTFDYNADIDGITVKYENQYLGVDDGKHAMAPVKPESSLYMNSNFREQQFTAYKVAGWYTPKIGEDGSLQKGPDGSVLLDKEWDFKNNVVTSDITLYAKLEKKPAIKLFFDGAVKQEVYVDRTLDITNRTLLDSLVKPEKDGWTFYDLFSNPEMTEPIVYPIDFDDGADVTLYPKFIEGRNWRIVKTETEFLNAYAANAKIYLDADLDFTGKTWRSKIRYNNELCGNNHTLSGIDYTVSGEMSNNNNLGLIGILAANSYLHDVTFENVSVTVNALRNVGSAGLLAGAMEKGARLTNVTVSGRLIEGNLQAADIAFYPVCPTIANATATDCDFANITIVRK